MNRTKIQYALIAHRQLTQAQEQASLWASHLDQRLGNLNPEEAAEFDKRTAQLINHLANDGPHPFSTSR